MYQELLIVGNLGRDPEMRYTPRGTPITQLQVATSRKWKDDAGELHEETTWFRVAVFGKMGEACAQYLEKGKKVLVRGTLVVDEKTGGPRVWERKDGTYGATFEVRAETVKFLSPRAASDARNGDGADEEFVDVGGDGVTEI